MTEQETQAQAQPASGAEAQAAPAIEKRTSVEDGTEFKGNLVSSCHVVVRGSIEGEVMAPKLTVEQSGAVVGNVNAEEIHSEGVLAGRIESDELYLSGQVRDDTVIEAKRMEVKASAEGQAFEVRFGNCTLAIGADPRAELSDAPATGIASEQAVSTAAATPAAEPRAPEMQADTGEAQSDAGTSSDAASAQGGADGNEAEALDEDHAQDRDGNKRRKGKHKRGAQASDDLVDEPRPSQAPPAH